MARPAAPTGKRYNLARTGKRRGNPAHSHRASSLKGARNMVRSKVRFLGLAALALMVVAACGSTTPGPAAKVVKVGLVTDIGGLNDKSFNHLAAVGLAKASSTGNICASLTCSKDFNVQGDVVESKTGDDYVPNLTNFATKGYDLVIGVGFLMGESIGTVSGQFKNVHFAIIDSAGTDAKGNDLQ